MTADQLAILKDVAHYAAWGMPFGLVAGIVFHLRVRPSIRRNMIILGLLMAGTAVVLYAFGEWVVPGSRVGLKAKGFMYLGMAAFVIAVVLWGLGRLFGVKRRRRARKPQLRPSQPATPPRP